MHARFNFTVDTPVIYIRDLGEHHTHKTVTSDADWVVDTIARQLRAKDDNIKHYHLVYEDSTGTWDGLKVVNEKFDNFISLNAKNQVEARHKILNHKYETV